MDSWKLREEIYQALSRWYFILAFILLGGIAGFVISYLAPSPYRAVAELYVGIDIERVNQLEYIIPLAEEEPLNLDDYKNWQLKQVADILKTDMVLKRALTALQKQNSAWEDIDLAEFRKKIDIYWYDTGIWRLEVTDSDQERAVEAVQTWLNTGYDVLTEKIQISQTGNAIDQDIWAFNLAISSLKTQRANCDLFLNTADEWLSEFEELSDSTQLDSEQYSALVEWSQVLDSENDCGAELTSPLPEQDDSVKDIREWLIAVQTGLEKTRDQYTGQMDILKEDRDQLLPEFYQYLDDTLGLSANVVLMPNTSEPAAQKDYSTENYTLGGSFIGLMAWLVYFAVGISTRKEDHGK